MAAVFKIGDRQGPVIYDKERHSSQYNLAHEVVHGNKARISLVMELSDRPYFYGLDRRPKPKKEREEISAREWKRSGSLIRMFDRESVLTRRCDPF